MQSRVATKLVSSPVRFWTRSATSTPYRTADPEFHAGEPDENNAAEEKKAKMAEKEGKRATVLKPQFTKPTPFASSVSIEHPQVNQPIHPINQQTRSLSDQSGRDPKDVSCVGVDGWPQGGNGIDKKRQEEEDKEYFKHHKASPLSEIKFADTRKPVTKATDNVRNAAGDVLMWREDQLESAEETLLRTMRVWKESAVRGVPDYPHSKALRKALRARGDYSLEMDLSEREWGL